MSYRSHPPQYQQFQCHYLSELNNFRSNSGSQAVGVSTITRKYFHILAVMIFLPGILLEAEMLCLAATCAFIVFVFLEVVIDELNIISFALNNFETNKLIYHL